MGLPAGASVALIVLRGALDQFGLLCSFPLSAERDEKRMQSLSHLFLLFPGWWNSKLS